MRPVALHDILHTLSAETGRSEHDPRSLHQRTSWLVAHPEHLVAGSQARLGKGDHRKDMAVPPRRTEQDPHHDHPLAQNTAGDTGGLCNQRSARTRTYEATIVYSHTIGPAAAGVATTLVNATAWRGAVSDHRHMCRSPLSDAVLTT